MPKNPHADFTPTLSGYSGITPFRFWCQTALPLTYDDSLSYYELLNKVVNYLNHTIEDLTTVENNTSELAEAYEKLQKYVNDYFDDIDIEAELRNVLDKMAEDGTLDALLDPLVKNQLPGVVDEKIGGVVAEQIDGAVAGQIDESVADQLPALVDAGIPGEVSDWLEKNVDPVGSAVMVDSSLTISGAAADAKVTGDELSDLKTQLSNSIGVRIGDYLDELDDKILKVHISTNLFDPSGTYENGRLMSDYTVKATGYEGVATTDFIPVEYPNDIIFTRVSSGTTRTIQDISAMACYDKDKQPLSYVLNYPNPQNHLPLTEGTAYIRISQSVVYLYTSASTYKPMISYGTTLPDYEPYYEPFYEILKNYPHTTDDITCWGDSLTYGSGSTAGHSYPDELQTMTGKTVYKCGFPGDTSDEIAGYQGSMPLVIAPVTIPATGSVNVEVYVYNRNADSYPFGYPSIDASNINPVEIAGIKGNLDLSATGSNTSNRTFAFTRLEDGDAKTLIDYTEIITNCAVERKNDISIIWVGSNGGWESTNSVLVHQVENMIKYQDAAIRKYIVVGLASGISPYYAISLAKDMTLAFGNHFIDMRDYLVRCGLTENGLTPTTQDEEDIAAGKVPTSLRVDSVHLNDYGYHSVASAIYTRGKILGYWD